MYVDRSSLASSLFSASPLGTVGQVGKIDSANSAGGSPADIAAKKAEAARSAQLSVLDEIREKGIYAWAQEKKLEKLEEKIREQVTKANPDADTATIENEIARQVKLALENALKTQAAAAAERGEPAKPMIIDISV